MQNISKSIVILILIILFDQYLNCQISTTKVIKENENVEVSLYDSSTSKIPMSKINHFLNQELYFFGKHKQQRDEGYSDFFINYDKPKKLESKNEYSSLTSNIYKCCGGGHNFNKTNYSEIAGHYFEVIEILPTQKTDYSYINYNCFLKLKNKSNGDTLYYGYKYSESSLNYQFIIVGNFNKIKNEIIGINYMFPNSIFEDAKDIKTGKIINAKTGELWKVIDLTYEEDWYHLSVVLQNSKNETFMIDYDWEIGTNFKSGYSEKQAQKYIAKFSKALFYKILNNELSIGMTKEMCKLSWGEPKEINETRNGKSIDEQWVYENGYLYFRNGKLTTIQD